MSWRLLFTFIISVFTSFSLYAVQCSDIFPGPQTFASNPFETLESGVTCNGVTCVPSTFTQADPLPGGNPSNNFSSTSMSAGVYEYGGWGLGDGAEVTFTGSGTAVVYFLDNDVVINKETKINVGGNPANVLLIFKGKLKIDVDAKINAFIYVKGSETVIEERVEINGAVSAKLKLSLKKDGTYIHNSSNVNELDPQGFCDATPVLEFSCDSTFPLTPSAFINSSEKDNLTPITISTATEIGGSNENNFGIININSGGELSFSSDFTNYYIEEINVLESKTGSAILNFKAGDYYIGEFESYADTTINIIGSGKVRIFLRDHSDFEGDTDINEGGDFEQLLIYGYDKVHFKNTSSMVGFVNATGDLDIKDSTDFNGKYYSGGNLKLTTSGSVTNACATPVEPAELVAKYTLEESSWSGSNSVLDSSGNNNHASPVGSIFSTLVDPVSCQALGIPTNTSKTTRDAINTGVDVNTLGDQGSIAFWYRNNTKWDTGSSDKVLFDASTSSGAQFLMYIWHGGFLEFEATEPDGDRAERYTSAKSYAASEWVHIAVTWDAINDSVKIYLNGVSQSLTDQTGKSLTQGLHTDMGELYFGDNNHTTASALGDSADGSMDEIHVYKNVLTQVEVDAIYVDVNDCVTPIVSCAAVFPSSYNFADQISERLTNFPTNNATADLTSTATIPRGNNFYEDSNLGSADEIFIGVAGAETTARVYLSAGVAWHNAKINQSGNPEDLIFIVDGGVIISGDDTVINAIIYAKGGATVSGNGTINGAVSTVGVAAISSTINFNASYIGNADFDNMCTTPTLDHFEIIHDGNGLTCAEESVTIKACTNAHGVTCTESTDAVTLNFRAGGIIKSTPTFIGSTSINFNHTVVNPALTLSINSPSITPTNNLECINGGSNSCDMNFAEAGFILDVNSGSDIASCASTNLTIKAVKLSDTGLSCAPAFTGSQSIDFIFNHVNPITANASTVVPVLASSNMAVAGDSQNRSITFDGNGEATLALHYNDAGRISIDVSENVFSGVSPASINKDFYPSKLIVSAKKIDNSLLNNTDAFGDPKLIAGENFNIFIEGQCADVANTVTSNYQPQGNTNVELSVQQQAPITATGTLTTGGGAIINATDLATTTWVDINESTLSFNAKYSEVGIINLAAQDTNYLDNTISTGGNVTVGRFIPDHFEVSIASGSFQDSCTIGANDFTYIGQSFNYDILSKPELTITAHNTDHNITKNYTESGYQKLVNTDIDRTFPAADTSKDGSIFGTKMTVSPATSAGDLVVDSAGVMKYTFKSSDSFTYNKDDNSLTTPFTVEYDISLTNMQESDSVNAFAGLLPMTIRPTGSNLRFGRWNIENGYGPETEDIPLRMQTQYWDGNNFVTNTDDVCTAYDAAIVANRTIENISLDPALTSSSGTGSFTLGLSEIIMSKPSDNPASQGQVRFIYTATPAWLKYDWDGNGSYSENPSGIAAFGLYRGNDRIISWREVGN